MRRVLLPIVFLACLALPTQADVNAGLDAYFKGDYVTAHHHLKPEAEHGNPVAQFFLGGMYAKGLGVPLDKAQAVRWYRAAAQQGDPDAQRNLDDLIAESRAASQKSPRWPDKALDNTEKRASPVPASMKLAVTSHRDLLVLARKGNVKAQNNLGFMYAEGRKVPRDYVQAARWYRKAAEKGHSTSEFNLGYLHLTGQGVSQDYVQAAIWFGKAAEQGNAMAQYNLGYMAAKGQGVPQDQVQALMWFKLAATQGDKRAVESLGKLMTPAQIEEAEKRAREWLRNHRRK